MIESKRASDYIRWVCEYDQQYEWEKEPTHIVESFYDESYCHEWEERCKLMRSVSNLRVFRARLVPDESTDADDLKGLAAREAQ